MATAISEELKQQLQRDGFAKTGDIGGQPKTRYWTPDGREILSAPSWREFTRRDAKGQLVESGVRDANFDKGWLPQKPTILKPFCPHCDLWHDTQEQIAECQRKRQSFDTRWLAKARKEVAKTDGHERLDALEKDMAEIKGLLLKLVEAKNYGKVLQPEPKGATQTARFKNNGKDAEEVE